MHRWPLSLLLLLPLALAAAPAAPPSATTPVTIEADRMELDQKNNTSRYQGHVILVQGSLRINADSITLYSTGGTLLRAVVDGSPATLQQQGADEAQTMRARATQMEYLPRDGVIELRGQAQLWRGGNEFNGEQIRYDLKQQLVRATGTSQGSDTGRVRVLLQPEGEQPATEEKP